MLARLGAGTVVVLLLCVGTLWIGKRWFVGGLARPASGAPQQLCLLEGLRWAVAARCTLSRSAA